MNKDNVVLSRLFGFFDGFGWAFRSLVTGKRMPTAEKILMSTSDAVYENDIPFKLVYESFEYAHVEMKKLGVVYRGTKDGAYKFRKFDCEDFAMLMKSLMTFYISQHSTFVDKGIPVGIFGYTRDDKKRHVIVIAVADEKTIYFEVYPTDDDRHIKVKELSPSEVNSCNLKVF